MISVAIYFLSILANVSSEIVQIGDGAASSPFSHVHKFLGANNVQELDLEYAKCHFIDKTLSSRFIHLVAKIFNVHIQEQFAIERSNAAAVRPRRRNSEYL